MANVKCNICGTEFHAIREKRYTARDLRRTGVIAAIGPSDEPKQFDAFDCPECGCQVVVQERKRNIADDDESFCEDEEDDGKSEGDEE